MSAPAVKPVRDALYEEPGPKTRVRIIVATVIASILVLLGLAFVVRQFYITGQLDPKYWEFFGRLTTWKFLGAGFWGTIKAAAVAVGAQKAAAIIAVCMHHPHRLLVTDEGAALRMMELLRV